MDGAFYNDLRDPHIFADVATVTLATTLKALYPPSNFPVLGGQYFARPGKKVRIRLFTPLHYRDPAVARSAVSMTADRAFPSTGEYR